MVVKRVIFSKRPENIVQKINLLGVSGGQSVSIPANYRYKYRYLSIYNDTGYKVQVGPWSIPAQRVVTVPFVGEMLEGFLVGWGADNDVPGLLKLIYHSDNVNYFADLRD